MAKKGTRVAKGGPRITAGFGKKVGGPFGGKFKRGVGFGKGKNVGIMKGGGGGGRGGSG